jgi:hypothetical protein
MKTKNYILSIILSLFVSSGFAQNLWKGDLHTEQLTEFHQKGFSEVDGNVLVCGTYLKDLHLLENVTIVHGNCTITKNDSLDCIRGLEKLMFIEGTLSFIENKCLNDYCALSEHLLKKGIQGVKIRRKIYDRFNAEDNEYNPIISDLLRGECAHSIYSFGF